MSSSIKKQRNSIFHALTTNFQRSLVRGTLDESKGNVSKAARKLGITRATLYTLSDKFNPSEAAKIYWTGKLERHNTDSFVPVIEE